MKMAIVGLGLIGGSLAKDLRGLGLCTELLGVDESQKNATGAKSLNLIDQVVPMDTALKKAELIILATPVDVIASLLPSVLDSALPNATITDMGSTKEMICNSVRNNKRRAQFIAAHPMAGTENSGPSAALAGLFTHKTAVICEKELSGAKNLSVVQKIFDSLKMRTVFMTPKDHDLHAAYVSHLSHISSFVLANAVLNKEKDATKIFDLAGGGFESTVRLAKSSPAMWAPIFGQNKNYVSQALSDYIECLKKFKKSIDGSDLEGMKIQMSEANEIRRVLNEMAERIQK